MRTTQEVPAHDHVPAVRGGRWGSNRVAIAGLLVLGLAVAAPAAAAHSRTG
jgi:hypothetical protein